MRFMLLMPWGRVGSNLLMAVLSQSARIKLDSERFNLLKTDSEQENWLKEFYELGVETTSSQYIGSKQNVLAICDFEAMCSRLIEHSIRIVRLKRENVVKTAISQMRAEQYADKTERETGKRLWAVVKGAERLGATEINPDTLFNRIELIDRLQRRLMAGFSGYKTLDLEYEDVNSSLSEVASQLCTFLSIPNKSTYRVPHMKATPDDVRSSISNLRAVEQKLAGTRYAEMLS